MMRLVSEPVYHKAEFAVRGDDRWQRLRTGSRLMDRGLEIATLWGFRSLLAEVAPSNQRMPRMFEHRGLVFEHGAGSDVVIARKREG